MTEENLYCPECGNPVTKAGAAWSGKKQFQQYRCPKCRRCTMRPIDSQGNKVKAKPYTKETK